MPVFEGSDSDMTFTSERVEELISYSGNILDQLRDNLREMTIRLQAFQQMNDTAAGNEGDRGRIAK